MTILCHSDSKSREESIPELVADGRVYVDGDNMVHVRLDIPQG